MQEWVSCVESETCFEKHCEKKNILCGGEIYLLEWKVIYLKFIFALS